MFTCCAGGELQRLPQLSSPSFSLASSRLGFLSVLLLRKPGKELAAAASARPEPEPASRAIPYFLGQFIAACCSAGALFSPYVLKNSGGI